MNILASLPLALALLATAAPASAAAREPATTGMLPVAANRLVGLWTTDIRVSVEACTPGAPEPPLIGRNTLVFNTGGTLVELHGASPIGVAGQPQLRTFGIGTWSYNPRTAQYSVLVRFDWYDRNSGAYLGYQEIDRTILLSNDRSQAYGPVVATRFAPDGSELGRMCGHAVSHRL